MIIVVFFLYIKYFVKVVLVYGVMYWSVVGLFVFVVIMIV